MKDQILGYEVSPECTYIEATTEESEGFPGWLLDDIHGFAAFLLDSDGRITCWNRGAMRLTGYSLEEINGRSFSFLYDCHKTYYPIPQYELNVAAHTGRCEKECVLAREDGSRFWARVMLMPIDDHQQPGEFAVMLWDISKYKGVEMDKIGRPSAMDDE